jgi:hypothetical protein
MLDKEGQQRSLNQFMQLFILPEIDRRKKDGKLPTNFALTQAQVIFAGDGSRPIIRLNDEAKIKAKVKLKEGIRCNKGDLIKLSDIDHIAMIRLPDDEEEKYAHLSMIVINREILFTFDFRYNKGYARNCFNTARQFFDSAKDALEKNRLAPFIDNLFSCVELLAKAELLLMPDPKFKQKSTHKGIQLKYDKYVNIGNAKLEFKTTLNKLAALRDSARYLKSDFELSDGEEKQYLDVASEMITYVEMRLRKHT